VRFLNIYKTINKDFEQLTQLEEILCYLYKNNMMMEDISESVSVSAAFQHLLAKNEQSKDNLWNIQKSFLDASLEEISFFTANSDLDVNVHPRYLPPKTHAHEFYEIQYVYSGSFQQTIMNTEIFLQKGDLCFIAPHTDHKVWVNSHDTILINILVRSSTFRSTFMNLMGQDDIVSDFFTKNTYQSGSSPYILCRTDSEEILQKIIMEMLDECARPKKYSVRYLNALLELFIIQLLRLHEFHFTIGKSTENVENESILAIMRYIQSNFRTVTLPDAAKFFNYSEAHLSRLIKKFTGKNFTGIIQTIKIQYSARLLAECKMSIAEIIDEVGYTDSSHFYRVFKRYYNMTPARYQQEQNTHLLHNYN